MNWLPSSIVWILLLGLIFHGVYMMSIFDIYFRSPVVLNVPAMSPPTSDAPAKRLVLFVADGLRADKMFELTTDRRHLSAPSIGEDDDDDGDVVDGQSEADRSATKEETVDIEATNSALSRAPFLRSIVEREGRWGVSHTRVPTESRPGHVALIAGFYEDVSAVTKGWKENPVEFDSVFNRSSHTWSWGSPDIVPMFALDVPHCDAYAYPPEAEDFASDTTYMDNWVFERVEEFFDEARHNETLGAAVRADKAVFFLHLLGIDSAGHARRPYSQQYLHNLAFVDKGIEGIVRLVNEFFDDDGRTAFVFTSDHGMSDKGSHGDGERANTETPLIVWGAGIGAPQRCDDATAAKPLSDVCARSPPSPPEWALERLARVDVHQADVAPLMSTLLGVPIPVNSVGVLPTALLSGDEEFKTRALLQNARSIHAQFAKKEAEQRERRAFIRAYTDTIERDADQLLASASAAVLSARNGRLGDGRQWADVHRLCTEAIELSLSGLHYYQTYDWPFLMSLITLGYLGWIVFIGTHILGDEAKRADARSDGARHQSQLMAAVPLLLAVGAYLVSQGAPLHYHVYGVFPVYFWTHVVAHRREVLAAQVRAFDRNAAVLTLSVLAALEAMVVGYFYRAVFSALLLLLGVSRTFGSAATGHSSRRVRAARLWLLACVLLAIFPLMPVHFGESARLAVGGGALCAFLCALAPSVLGFETGTAHYVWSAAVALSAVCVWHTERSLAAGTGLPLPNQIFSWTMLVLSALLTFVEAASARRRGTQHWAAFLALLFARLAAPYVLLSVAFESLFFAAFAVVLCVWLYDDGVADKRASVSVAAAGRADVHRCLVYLFLCYVAFFGTGNVASLSSFEISSTYRFTTVFAPFLMGALLIYKVLVPFALVSCAFHVLLRRAARPAHLSLFVILALSDVMTVNFFFLVRDEGSWLDIGVSISHFALANFYGIIQLLMFTLSHYALAPVNHASVRDSVNEYKRD